MDTNRKLISLCVCCYNEEENIDETYRQIINVIDRVPECDFEILFADNSSTDKTQEKIRIIAQNDKRVKAIFNSTNFGPNMSGVNLALNASGDALISLPADLQEPIDMIPNFIEYWLQGYDVVFGSKTSSEENPITFFCRKVYYKIINMMSDVEELYQVTGFGLIDRRVYNVMWDTIIQDPFIDIRHYIVKYGFRVKLIPYKQLSRKAGKSSYSIYNLYSHAITSLCATSIKPLRYMTILGILLGTISFLVALVYLFYKITHWYSFDLGIAPAVIGLFFLSGFHLFCIGIIGEYIIVLLRKVTIEPRVTEKERINFDQKDE